MEKLCRGCGVTKSVDQFSVSRIGAAGKPLYRSRCKPCTVNYTVKWQENNPDRVLHTHLLRKYGITLENYREILATQQGVCAICKLPPQTVTWKPGPRTLRGPKEPRLVVDHDHRTGKVRGLLCFDCNTGIGLLKDDPGVLDAALKYLGGQSD